VTNTFLATGRIHGLPASTLTDNGLIFTTRFAHGKGGPNHFEHIIAGLGIIQKNGHPGHPQTQGKIERFHQTLKRWLAARDDADTLEDLQALLDAFAHVYNVERPHRSLGRRTPAEAYTALPKTGPTIELLQRHWRVRHDTVDTAGKVTLRWAGKLRHLGIGRTHAGAQVLLLVAGTDTLVINHTTGEIIAEHHLNEDRDYQPKKRQKTPPEGEAPVNDAPRHLQTMSRHITSSRAANLNPRQGSRRDECGPRPGIGNVNTMRATTSGTIHHRFGWATAQRPPNRAPKRSIASRSALSAVRSSPGPPSRRRQTAQAS